LTQQIQVLVTTIAAIAKFHQYNLFFKTQYNQVLQTTTIATFFNAKKFLHKAKKRGSKENPKWQSGFFGVNFHIFSTCKI
jgi:predicted lactoylglutathione lyase